MPANSLEFDIGLYILKYLVLFHLEMHKWR